MLQGRLSLLSLSLVLLTPSAWSDTLPSRAEMWKMIQQQQKEIQALKAIVQESQPKLEQASNKAEESLRQTTEVRKEIAKEEAKPGDLAKWTDRITLSGTVEVEAYTARNFARVRTSDINLATAELGLDFKINDWVNSQVVMLYEDPDTPLGVDQATITIGDTSKNPLFLTAGRMTVPFGNYTTNMVSDPLTLSLAENGGEGTVQVGFEYQGFRGSVYAFNGDVGVNNRNDTIRQGGATLGYSVDQENLKLDVGVEYTNSLDDSDTITTAIQNVIPGSSIEDHVAAVAGHVVVQHSGFTAIGEYIAAQDSFRANELAWAGGLAKPRAWHTELGYTFEVMEKETTVSVGWQGTDEALALGLPEERLLCAVKVGILENTSLGLEYAHDEDYETTEGGTGRSGHVATAQLAVTF